MAWEMKGKYGPYYYRKKREGRKVRSIYEGRGISGLNASKMVEQRKNQREAERASFAKTEQDLSAMLNAFQEVDRLTAKAILERAQAEGLHRSARWKWRRKRV